MAVKVLLTGARGYLGGVLLRYLADKKEIHSITGVDYSNPGSEESLPPNVKLLSMDIRSPQMEEVMAGHDVVIHTASIVQWRASMSAQARDDINFNGIRSVARAALKHKVKSFLQASSIAAYDPLKVQSLENVDEAYPIGDGNSSMYYLNAKSTCERILNEMFAGSATKLAFLRMCYIVGPGDNSVIRSFCDSAVRFPSIDPRIQFVHEADVAQAFYIAVKKELSGIYNVVPDDFLHLSDVYRLNDVKPLVVPVWLAKTIQYLRWRFLGAITHPSWVQGTLLDFSLSNAKLRAAGWAPEYSTAQAILAANK